MRSLLNHLIGRNKRILNNESEEISGFRGDNLIIVTSVEDDIEETMETHKQGLQGPQLQVEELQLIVKIVIVQ